MLACSCGKRASGGLKVRSSCGLKSGSYFGKFSFPPAALLREIEWLGGSRFRTQTLTATVGGWRNFLAIIAATSAAVAPLVSIKTSYADAVRPGTND